MSQIELIYPDPDKLPDDIAVGDEIRLTITARVTLIAKPLPDPSALTLNTSRRVELGIITLEVND